VRVLRQEFTPERNAIGSHACSLEASKRVTNGIPLGCPLFLPVHSVNCVQTLKVAAIAAKYGMYVIAPILELSSPSPSVSLGNGTNTTSVVYNTAVVIDRTGAVIGAYRKNFPVLGTQGMVRVFGRNLHSMMPLDPTHVRFKRTCV
jgi:hypothetical protein